MYGVQLTVSWNFAARGGGNVFMFAAIGFATSARTSSWQRLCCGTSSNFVCTSETSFTRAVSISGIWAKSAVGGNSLNKKARGSGSWMSNWRGTASTQVDQSERRWIFGPCNSCPHCKTIIQTWQPGR